MYAVPVIVSAGPDTKFGLPAVDSTTWYFPIGATATSTNPVATIWPVYPPPASQGTPTITNYQDMRVLSAGDEKDNLYSYRKIGS
jgi:hypothetical protein